MLHNDRMVVTWYQIIHYSRLKRKNAYNGMWKYGVQLIIGQQSLNLHRCRLSISIIKDWKWVKDIALHSPQLKYSILTHTHFGIWNYKSIIISCGKTYTCLE